MAASHGILSIHEQVIPKHGLKPLMITKCTDGCFIKGKNHPGQNSQIKAFLNGIIIPF